MAKVIVFMIVCGALVFASGSLGNSAQGELKDYRELTTSATAEVHRAVLTEIEEREVRSRRGTTTNYCPKYTYAVDGFDRTHRAFYLCQGGKGSFAIGDVVELYEHESGYPAFVKSDLTEKTIKSDVSRNGWLFWGGIAGIAVSVLIIVFKIKIALYERRQAKQSQLNPNLPPA